MYRLVVAHLRDSDDPKERTTSRDLADGVDVRRMGSSGAPPGVSEITVRLSLWLTTTGACAAQAILLLRRLHNRHLYVVERYN